MPPANRVSISLAAFKIVGATETDGEQPPPRLQLTIGVPPSMSIIRDAEISEAFAYRVSPILKEQGFRFTAEIKTNNGAQRLGLFTGTSIMRWMRRDWFARADGFEDAARDAISTLASRLELTGLMDRSVRR